MYGAETMPETAENVASDYNITREAQDQFAVESQQRAKNAMEENRFENEIVPVIVKDRKGNEIIVDQDEHPRPETTFEKLGKLKTDF